MVCLYTLVFVNGTESKHKFLMQIAGEMHGPWSKLQPASPELKAAANYLRDEDIASLQQKLIFRPQEQ
jgi:hypothetical protein